MTEKVAVRALPRLAAVLFMGWGTLFFIKGMWDCFVGGPEANFYSSRPWEFVTREQWFRFAGFEAFYGAAVFFLGRALWIFSKRLPAWREREKSSFEPI
ncbi:MAG TPA: hypothetical protein P5079_08840 [Elusimicrobiota bacterium]|nr:hypothetical protein [Elusimicrobiota bacterium]